MKKLFLTLLAVGCACWAMAQRSVDDANYYIEGTYVPNAKAWTFSLNSPQGNGIHFANEGKTHKGTEDNGSVVFTFTDATTTCPSNFSKGLSFYTWSESDQRWVRRTEVRNGEQGFSQDRSMLVMLVLDCSSSLGADFSRVKKSAISFIQNLAVASQYKGNIYIGIVGFNSKMMPFDIVPLTTANEEKLTSFINNLTMDDITRLYMAMHRGSDMIDAYAETMKDAIGGAFMVSFTDGYDNASMDRTIGGPQEYFNYVKSNIVDSKRVKGVKLESYVIAVKGDEVSQQEFDQLKQLATSDSRNSEQRHFIEGSIKEINEAFTNLSGQLIRRWQNIYCYIPMGYQGKVRWVLNCDGDEVASDVKNTVSDVKNEGLGFFKNCSNSYGIILGPGEGLWGASAKRQCSKIALMADFGLQVRNIKEDETIDGVLKAVPHKHWVLELALNVAYCGTISEGAKHHFYWMAGGGLPIGLDFSNHGAPKIGGNVLGGLGVTVADKVDFQFDIRPGIVNMLKPFECPTNFIIRLHL
jgi:Mg-chelatase subunit ChlD